MRRRRQIWLGGAGWSVCFLMAGCLHYERIEPVNASARAEQTTRAGPGTVATAPLVIETPPPEPPNSSYHPLPFGLVTRLQASTDPIVEAAGFHITPKQEPFAESEPPAARVEVSPPRPPKDAPLVAALRRELEKHPEEARTLLEQYDKTDRDLLLALLSLTAEVGEGELDKLPPREVERALEQLQSLTMHLRPRAPLELGKVCFCRDIRSFGQYTPLPAEHEFQAGCDGRPGERVQVYAEVRNFGSILLNGQYETRVLGSLSVQRAGAQSREHAGVVITENLDLCRDRSLTPRQDFFVKFQFHVFPRLPPGLYTLWITVKDVTPGQQGGPRIAKRSLDFRICAPGTVPLAGEMR